MDFDDDSRNAISDLLCKLNVAERCKVLGQAYLQLESVEKELRLKISTCNTHTTDLVESLQRIIGFLKYAQEFSYTVEDFIKHTNPTVKEQYKDLIDKKILEERYDPYNAFETNFWMATAEIGPVEVTNDFSILKEKEICRPCYYCGNCKTRNELIRDELRKQREISSGNLWNVITECKSFKGRFDDLLSLVEPPHPPEDEDKKENS